MELFGEERKQDLKREKLGYYIVTVSLGLQSHRELEGWLQVLLLASIARVSGTLDEVDSEGKLRKGSSWELSVANTRSSLGTGASGLREGDLGDTDNQNHEPKFPPHNLHFLSPTSSCLATLKNELSANAWKTFYK